MPRVVYAYVDMGIDTIQPAQACTSQYVISVCLRHVAVDCTIFLSIAACAAGSA